MARDMKDWRLKPIDLRSKKSESEKTEHECSGGTQSCGLCAGLVKESCPAQEVCDKKLCPETLGIPCCVNCDCKEEPQFVGIDYTRD